MAQISDHACRAAALREIVAYAHLKVTDSAARDGVPS